MISIAVNNSPIQKVRNPAFSIGLEDVAEASFHHFLHMVTDRAEEERDPLHVSLFPISCLHEESAVEQDNLLFRHIPTA